LSAGSSGVPVGRKKWKLKGGKKTLFAEEGGGGE